MTNTQFIAWTIGTLTSLAMASSHHNITTILMSTAPTTIMFTNIALPPIPWRQPIILQAWILEWGRTNLCKFLFLNMYWLCMCRISFCKYKVQVVYIICINFIKCIVESKI